jgi:hypothetical protein
VDLPRAGENFTKGGMPKFFSGQLSDLVAAGDVTLELSPERFKASDRRNFTKIEILAKKELPALCGLMTKSLQSEF